MTVDLYDVPVSNTSDIFSISIEGTRIGPNDAKTVSERFDTIRRGPHELNQITPGDFEYHPGHIAYLEVQGNEVALRVARPGESETVIVFR